MDREELDIILKEGEGYKIEFKEGISHLEKEMVAFSNSSGGRIFLGETVFRRNHIIADLFTRIDFGEKMGTGFERIREICQDKNAPFPEIDYNESYFYVTFRQSGAYLELARKEEEGLVERLVEGLVESQKRIFGLVKENPFISKREMADIIGISTTAIDKNIVSLKKKNLLRRVGYARGGHWEVLKEK